MGCVLHVFNGAFVRFQVFSAAEKALVAAQQSGDAGLQEHVVVALCNCSPQSREGKEAALNALAALEARGLRLPTRTQVLVSQRIGQCLIDLDRAAEVIQALHFSIFC
jgi:hypothetical protein